MIKDIEEAYMYRASDYRCNKKIFFVEEILNLTTYDEIISEKLYDYIVPVIKYHLREKDFDWSGNDEKYFQYMIVCNLILGQDENALNWGTSIRGAWWETLDRDLIGFGRDIHVTIETEDMIEIIKWVEE